MQRHSLLRLPDISSNPALRRSRCRLAAQPAAHESIGSLVQVVGIADGDVEPTLRIQTLFKQHGHHGSKHNKNCSKSSKPTTRDHQDLLLAPTLPDPGPTLTRRPLRPRARPQQPLKHPQLVMHALQLGAQCSNRGVLARHDVLQPLAHQLQLLQVRRLQRVNLERGSGLMV